MRSDTPKDRKKRQHTAHTRACVSQSPGSTKRSEVTGIVIQLSYNLGTHNGKPHNGRLSGLLHNLPQRASALRPDNEAASEPLCRAAHPRPVRAQGLLASTLTRSAPRRAKGNTFSRLPSLMPACGPSAAHGFITPSRRIARIPGTDRQDYVGFSHGPGGLLRPAGHAHL